MFNITAPTWLQRLCAKGSSSFIAANYANEWYLQHRYVLDAGVFGSDIQIPINLPFSAIPLFQPLVCFLEVPAIELHLVSTQSPWPDSSTYESLVRTQWTGMHALQHQMLLLVNALDSLLSRTAPCKKHNSACSSLSHHFNHLLCELLPSFLLVAVGFVRSHSQASVQEQHSIVGPWREQTSILWWWLKLWIFLLQRCVDVL